MDHIFISGVGSNDDESGVPVGISARFDDKKNMLFTHRRRQQRGTSRRASFGWSFYRSIPRYRAKRSLLALGLVMATLTVFVPPSQLASSCP